MRLRSLFSQSAATQLRAQPRVPGGGTNRRGAGSPGRRKVSHSGLLHGGDRVSSSLLHCHPSAGARQKPRGSFRSQGTEWAAQHLLPSRARASRALLSHFLRRGLGFRPLVFSQNWYNTAHRTASGAGRPPRPNAPGCPCPGDLAAFTPMPVVSPRPSSDFSGGGRSGCSRTPNLPRWTRPLNK